MYVCYALKQWHGMGYMHIHMHLVLFPVMNSMYMSRYVWVHTIIHRIHMICMYIREWFISHDVTYIHTYDMCMYVFIVGHMPKVRPNKGSTIITEPSRLSLERTQPWW